MTITLIHCPSCGKANDVTNRQLYDRIWCMCGQWFMIGQHRNGTWYAVKVEPPATYPWEKRR